MKSEEPFSITLFMGHLDNIFCVSKEKKPFFEPLSHLLLATKELDNDDNGDDKEFDHPWLVGVLFFVQSRSS